MAGGLTTQEMETHLNLVADSRDTWHAFSSDEVMQHRLERAGAVVVKVHKTAAGEVYAKEYTLRADQILIRAGKRHVSDEQRRAAGERFKALRQATT